MNNNDLLLDINFNISSSLENTVDNEYFTNLIIRDQSEFKEMPSFKLCSVCGDRALGYNFGAITCESCKAFFRRNANKSTETACLFNENCEITIITRRFCTHCRLMKCFKVQMKKENIIGHKDKRKKSKKSDKSVNTYSNSLELVEKTHSVSPDSSLLSVIGEKIFSDDIVNDSNIRIDFPNKLPPAESITADCISSPSRSNVIDRTDSFNPTIIMSISKKSKLISINDKLSREGMARLLNEDEWNILFYVHKAYIDSFFESGSMPPSAIENANLINLVNSSGFLVRKLISFAKCLTEFTSLEQPCQISLLKGAVLNSLILRSAVEYNIDKNVWITPQGEISSDIIKAAGLFSLQEDYAKYCRSFKKVLGSDEYLISITQVLCLFSSDNLSLTDRQFVSDIHDKYLILLKHYLESIHGFVESRSIFVLVTSNLIDLQCLTSKYGQILLHIDPTNVDPLMLEVFNMNSTNIVKSG